MSPTLQTSLPRNSQRGSDLRRGAVTVEFALCASIFFMFIFGMLEISRYLYVQQSVQMSAYEAARAGVIPGATYADVQARGNELMAATGVDVFTMSITPPVINNLTENVSVTINCNFAANSWVPPFFVPDTEISSTITLQHENMAYLQPGDTNLSDIIGDNEGEPTDL